MSPAQREEVLRYELSEHHMRIRSILLIGGLASFMLSPDIHAQLSGGDVNRSVESGIQYLIRAQGGNGAWHYSEPYEPGLTALAVLALTNAGVSKDHPTIQRGLQYILNTKPERTYAIGLVLMALAEVDPVQFRKQIEFYGKWLIEKQADNGTWNYDGTGPGDHSNTQFGVLGLFAARSAGLRIPPFNMQRIIKHFTSVQNRDGGWGYNIDGGSTPQMTAAGTTSLLIAGDRIFYPDVNCGRYKQSKNIAGGISYIADTWNPAQGGVHAYYTIYALERVGILSGRKFLGRHDWYAELASTLVRSQNAMGGWGGANQNGVKDSCFALLALAKGKVPVLVNKLQWDGDWNNAHNDMRNLTAFISTELGRNITWQAMSSKAELEDWMSAPLMYMNGTTAPNLDIREREQLRECLDRGTVLFVEACCGNKDFDIGFRKLMAEMYPDRQLEKLEPAHEVYRNYFPVNAELAQMEGLDMGCRTGIIYSRRSLAWDLERNFRLDQAFKIGTNIALYAMGELPLKDKLDRIALQSRKKEPESEPADEQVKRGALTIAQIKHQSDWNANQLSIRHLQEFLQAKVDVTVTSERHPIDLTSPDLPNFPILFVTGHHAIHFNEQQREALRQHLKRGGFLLADNGCGHKTFDGAFREEMKLLFPDNDLKPLSQKHAVYTCGYDLTSGKVKYRPIVTKHQPDIKGVILEGIEMDGRTVVVYSPFSLGCALDGHNSPQCKGVEARTEEEEKGKVGIVGAFMIAANVIIYAMGY